MFNVEYPFFQQIMVFLAVWEFHKFLYAEFHVNLANELIKKRDAGWTEGLNGQEWNAGLIELFYLIFILVGLFFCKNLFLSCFILTGLSYIFKGIITPTSKRVESLLSMGAIGYGVSLYFV